MPKGEIYCMGGRIFQREVESLKVVWSRAAQKYFQSLDIALDRGNGLVLEPSLCF
jgi:hypothetical protein